MGEMDTDEGVVVVEALDLLVRNVTADTTSNTKRGRVWCMYCFKRNERNTVVDLVVRMGAYYVKYALWLTDPDLGCVVIGVKNGRENQDNILLAFMVV